MAEEQTILAAEARLSKHTGHSTATLRTRIVIPQTKNHGPRGFMKSLALVRPVDLRA
jgi:hypothetical protein